MRLRGEGSVMEEKQIFEIENGRLIRYYGRESHVKVPEGVTSVAPGAFPSRDRYFYGGMYRDFFFEDDGDFKGVQSVEIPEGVMELEDDTFKHIESLCEVILPASLRRIGSGAFSHSGFSMEELPDTVEEIGEGAFEHCMRLHSFRIPPRMASSIS